MIFMSMTNQRQGKGVSDMKMERVLIQLPTELKAKLDALRNQGYTASGYIRALLERELSQPKKKGV
jgi:metal-responsive CopG/Arc/MetJ family transcriptional regulator